MKMKKSIAYISAALLASSTFVGCSGSSAGENGTINVFNCGDYIDPSLIKQFEKETGIKVNYDTYDTNEIMYQKVKTNPGTYDLVVPSDYMIEKMIAEDMVETIDFSNIPNYQYIGEEYKSLSYDPNNEYSVPYMWGTIGIIYDPEVVTEPVTSWDILWNEQYKDNVYMFNSIRDTMAIGLIKTGSSINSTDVSQIKLAKDALIEQRTLTNPVYVVDEVKDNMIAGEKALATVWSGDAIYIMNENPNLKYAIPEEGSNKWFDALAIPKDAPNKSNAEAFINFLCNPDNALKNVEYIEYSTPNTAAFEMLDEETKNNPAAYPSKEVLARCEIFTNLNSEILKLYESSFTDILSN
ncbi:MAG: ABC transporter substrate-binding protein [Clostridium sp.]|nr:ABC transporter substrate-binding protein [Clostridium sp.]